MDKLRVSSAPDEGFSPDEDPTWLSHGDCTIIGYAHPGLCARSRLPPFENLGPSLSQPIQLIQPILLHATWGQHRRLQPTWKKTTHSTHGSAARPFGILPRAANCSSFLSPSMDSMRPPPPHSHCSAYLRLRLSTAQNQFRRILKALPRSRKPCPTGQVPILLLLRTIAP
jgi:hypothetical protein